MGPGGWRAHRLEGLQVEGDIVFLTQNGRGIPYGDEGVAADEWWCGGSQHQDRRGPQHQQEDGQEEGECHVVGSEQRHNGVFNLGKQELRNQFLTAVRESLPV